MKIQIYSTNDNTKINLPIRHLGEIYKTSRQPAKTHKKEPSILKALF